MNQSSKPFMAWVTDLKHNVFLKARIRLTFFYVLFMIIIIGLFSSILLSEIDRNLHTSFRRYIDRNEIAIDELETASRAIRAFILTVDGFLLVFIGAASYILAGRTLRPIREALDSQKRFMADVSHDLRTPLAIMKTETEVMLQGEQDKADPSAPCDPVEYKRVLESNLEEINKMSLMVADLLLLARTEGVYEYFDSSAHQMSEIQNIEIGSFVTRIVEKLQKSAEAKNISLAIQGSLGSAHVSGHQHSLERAIQNILQNAINYTKENGKIDVLLSEGSSTARIIIRDTGVGISKADLPHVFNRFYKASHSRQSGSGSGLGLPIAKQIIEQHGGTISIMSKEGKGTDVALVLPKVRG